MLCVYDDPMFALMLRFVGSERELSICSRDLVQKQLDAITEYVDSFPEQERNERALEWIEMYAREYRRKWVTEAMGEQLSDHRCPDCPLTEATAADHCSIHARWLELIQEYAAGNIDSHNYVDGTLGLLAQHKEDLKIKLSVLQ